MKKILIFLFLLGATIAPCLAQNGHYVGTAQGLAQNGFIVSLPNAKITVCSNAANCSGTVLNLCSSLIDVTCNLPGTFYADSQGNFDFYIVSGVYQIQVSKAGFSSYFLKDVSVTSGGGSSTNLHSPTAIGDVTPNTGNFSQLGVNGITTLGGSIGISTLLFNGPDPYGMCNANNYDQLTDITDLATGFSSLAWNPNCPTGANQRVFTTAFQGVPYLNGNVWSFNQAAGLPTVANGITIDPQTGSISNSSITNNSITTNSIATSSITTGLLGVTGVSVPVESFGAVGDWNGTTGTDNTTAIQACLNSLTSGVCLLQAKAYKITSALSITKSNVGLVGVVPTSINTSLFPTPASSSVIITTSASADILDVAGSGTLANTILKNFTLERSVIPTGTAKGLSIVNSYAAVVDRVISMDSIYGFYFKGVGSLGFGAIENSAAGWGYNGITETTGSLYGFYVDTTTGVFSPSIRIRNSFASSNFSTGPTTYGFANTGTITSDWHLLHDETAGLNYGMYVNSSGAGFAASSDIQIVDPINDGCLTACIYSTGLTGSITVTGGWSATAGAAIDFESGAAASTASVVNHTVYGSGITGISGLIIGHNSSNVQLIGNRIHTEGGTNVPLIFLSGVVGGAVTGNTLWAATATTTLFSIVNTINVIVSSDVLQGTSTNGILIDSASRGIGGLETDSCGTAVGTITNCVVDNNTTNPNMAGFTSGFFIIPTAFANLPTCAAGFEGTFRAVTNSNTATYNATVTGGGTNHIPVYCNGTNWVAH